MPWTVYNSDGQILQGSATLADDSVDSQHYAAASIDNEHLADDAVGADELAANAVVNASIASAAQITFDKMVNLTTSRALVTDGSGDIIVSGVTTTELELLDGLTSSTAELNLLDGVSGLVQADLTKLAAIDATAAEIDLLDALDRGSIIYGNSSGATTVLGQGSADTVLTSDGTDIAWAAGGGNDISCRVMDESTQAIANETWVNVNFDAEQYDTDTMHDTSTNNERITFTTAGVYVVSGGVDWTANGTGYRMIGIYKNNSTYIALRLAGATAAVSGLKPDSIATVYKFDADDYVTLQVRQASGGTLNINPTNDYGSEFSAAKILG